VRVTLAPGEATVTLAPDPSNPDPFNPDDPSQPDRKNYLGGQARRLQCAVMGGEPSIFFFFFLSFFVEIRKAVQKAKLQTYLFFLRTARNVYCLMTLFIRFSVGRRSGIWRMVH
jgi:hypothetical protein